MATKTTKKECYTMLIDIVEHAVDTGYLEDTNTIDTLMNFLKNEIRLLESKAEAARNRAIAKKAEGDELRQTVLDVLSDTDYQTIDQILAKVHDITCDDEITRAMVASRLAQLGEKGTNQIEKQTNSHTTEGGKARRVTTYRKLAD